MEEAWIFAEFAATSRTFSPPGSGISSLSPTPAGGSTLFLRGRRQRLGDQFGAGGRVQAGEQLEGLGQDALGLRGVDLGLLRVRAPGHLVVEFRQVHTWSPLQLKRIQSAN